MFLEYTDGVIARVFVGEAGGCNQAETQRRVDVVGVSFKHTPFNPIPLVRS